MFDSSWKTALAYAVMLFCICQVVHGAENLVKNGGFEEGAAYWKLQGKSGLVKGEAKSGNSCIKLKGSEEPGERNRCRQVVRLNQKECKSVKASCWMKWDRARSIRGPARRTTRVS